MVKRERAQEDKGESRENAKTDIGARRNEQVLDILVLLAGPVLILS